MKTLYQQLNKKLNTAIATYNLINDGDKILIGLSGGKDSLCLTQLLANKAKITHPNFTVEAIHIRMRNIKYITNTEYLQNFTSQLGVKLHIVETEFEMKDDCKKPACFLCSWHRRKQLFNFAQENNFNKIALGHHMDDIIHTSLMNLFYQGRFATMPASLKMKKMPLTIIRPLCMINEKDVVTFAAENNYQKQEKQCPYEKQTQRTEMRKMFESLEAMNPEVRFSIFGALNEAGKLVE